MSFNPLTNSTQGLPHGIPHIIIPVNSKLSMSSMADLGRFFLLTLRGVFLLQILGHQLLGALLRTGKSEVPHLHTGNLAVLHNRPELTVANAVVLDPDDIGVSDDFRVEGQLTKEFLKDLLPWSKNVQEKCSNRKNLNSAFNVPIYEIASKMPVSFWHGTHG